MIPVDPPSGRALDREIHLHIFGHSTQSACQLCPQGFYLNPENRCPHVPAYSSDIGAAWLVVERMREQGYTTEIRLGSNDSQAWVHMIGRDWDHPNASALEATAPLAICRAALSAIEGRRVDG